MRPVLFAAASCLALTAPGGAQTTSPDSKFGTGDGSFGLGQIIVTAQRLDDGANAIAIGAQSVGSEALFVFNRNSLDDAASLIPGVTAANTGGSRNERLIFVRGFDRFQVPLSIDGIRVYLPADNRLDYGRFLTPDIAQIQVAKSYASVLDGPGAMGGAINLVTRRPTRTFEAEARGEIDVNRDADYQGYTTFGSVGTNQGRWYAQASYARSARDHYSLSGAFTPTANEDGGLRARSDTRDWRVNAKIGFTPNATDEYAISYTRQEGAKNAPQSVSDDIVAPIAPGNPSPRFWTWPYWNIDSLYFLSTTAISDAVTLKTRIYRNSFDNLLSAFDDVTQTKQTLGRAFNSFYEDEAHGGSVQLDIRPSEADAIALAAHYRRDKHVEYQQSFPAGTTEPPQADVEDTHSIAAQNRLALSPHLSWTAGVSYDWRNLSKAQDYGVPPGAASGTPSAIFSYPLADAHAFNWQTRLDWTSQAGTRLHASVSRRARFPTIFERFSTQFGTAASNPGLKAEVATNFEIGGSRTFGKVHLDGAIFYSHIDDAIVAVRPSNFPAGTSQRQNLGNGDYYGAEISFDADVAPTLHLGANYGYIRRSFEIQGAAPGTNVPVFQLTDVPTHKGFAWIDWSPLPRLHVLPSVEVASDRTLLQSFTPTPPGVPVYFRAGNYGNAALRVDYAIGDHIDVGVGARNLFDANYQLADGFPEPGRSFFATVRARY